MSIFTISGGLFFALLIAVMAVVLVRLLSSAAGGGGGVSTDQEVTRLAQELHERVTRMEDRIEALETIILDKSEEGRS